MATKLPSPRVKWVRVNVEHDWFQCWECGESVFGDAKGWQLLATNGECLRRLCDACKETWPSRLKLKGDLLYDDDATPDPESIAIEQWYKWEGPLIDCDDCPTDN